MAFTRYRAHVIPGNEPNSVRLRSTCAGPAEYDHERQVLRLAYNSGQKYNYLGVSQTEYYAALLNAPSIGRSVNSKKKTSKVGHGPVQRQSHRPPTSDATRCAFTCRPHPANSPGHVSAEQSSVVAGSARLALWAWAVTPSAQSAGRVRAPRRPWTTKAARIDASSRQSERITNVQTFIPSRRLKNKHTKAE